ncbi:hypothetical protein [Streptomyces megasporus]|uniref:hypothetical protein n=1 Tax=Streptomyces megasporus TaxID=44060 RepID=UPI0004E122D7|nr:hypothetical protein [Streptomyces megasporus]
MRERELRRRCRRLLNELGIRPPLDVAELCRRVEERRGRPLRLVPYPIPVPGPFGMWVGAPTADYIVFQKETSRAHQRHIILHELGHILADHRGDEHGDELLTELRRGTEGLPPEAGFFDLDPDVVRRALRRTAYDSEQEREAETVATIILEWAAVLDHVAPRASADAAAQRIGTSLGDRLGWL